ncbi:MAG: hypothetical protein J6Y20_02890, partial [Lachnospiraceae bacterium]|nr:hypothetical protein [Lachnospiraceae bacterium]
RDRENATAFSRCAVIMIKCSRCKLACKRLFYCAFVAAFNECRDRENAVAFSRYAGVQLYHENAVAFSRYAGVHLYHENAVAFSRSAFIILIVPENDVTQM